jgi:hypothetical protein
VNKHAALQKDTNILSRGWVFVFITNNPIRVDPLIAESMISALTNGKKLKVKSLTGRLCDIWEIFFGTSRLSAPKMKCKISEGNQGNEHVFDPMVNFGKLCHVAQYPIINMGSSHTFSPSNSM